MPLLPQIPDADDTITYSLGGTDAASFDIVSTSGQLQTKAALDFETKTSYSISVIATDSDDATDTIPVTIDVTDVNEAPAFASETTTRSVAENTGSGVNIGDAVSATDPDTSDTLEYTLGGTDSASFDIGSTNGQLRTKAALDYERKTSYAVTVSVSDGNGGTDSIAVTINVTDVAENRPPAFANESTTRSIAENTGPGVNIGSPVSATDPDTTDTLEYSLGGTDSDSFDIGSTNGQLRTKAALDYETKTSHSVTVSVSDGNGGSDSIAVTINVTDVAENTAPSFSSETTTRSIAENTGSGVDIGDAVFATDPDTTDTLEYSLGGTDASSFSINSASGQLRTSAALNYEDTTSYSVTVSVSDGNGGSDSIAVTINITNVNEAPAFTDSSPASRSIAENTATDQNIGSAVSATDPDSGDSLTYGLGGTDAASFSIDSSSGQLKTKAALDHETKNAYTVIVSVSDSDSLSASITVNISITDVNEAPEFTDGASTTRSVRENSASGENIGSAVAATDPDGNTLTYTLGGTDAATFSVVSTSGQLQTSGALDYDTKDSYSVTLTVSDGTLSDTIAVTISVDENTAPAFAETSFSERISDIENATVGDSIGDPVTASDDDSDTLTYSLGGTDAGLFDIDSESGQLKVTQALIDGTSSQYSITVIANDDYEGTAQITGTIYVTRQATQMANNAPVFADDSTTRSVEENTASGENIGDPITATDADADDTLTYSLEGTDASSFSIDSETGQIQTSAALDYDTKNSYTVTVKVEDDSGASNNSDTITVTINVTEESTEPAITPVADRTPEIRDEIVNQISGVDSAADVTAADLESVQWVHVGEQGISSLKSGDLDGLTNLWWLSLRDNNLSSLPGDLFSDNTSLSIIDLSGNQFSSLPDGLFKGLTSLNSLELDDNSTNPIPFTVNIEADGLGYMKATIPIGAPFDFVIPITVTNGTYGGGLTKLIVNKGDVESETGFVTRTDGTTDAVTVDIGTLPDLPEGDGIHYVGFILQKSSDLPVTVIEAGETPTSDNNPPIFTDGSSTTRSVAENMPIATNIGTPIGATDEDSDTLTYSYIGDDTSFFTLDTSNGQLSTKIEHNYERRNSYSFILFVNDGNGGSASIDVTISISDVDENDPFAPLEDRSPEVAAAILNAIPDASSFDDVTLDQLTAITELNLSNKSISELYSNDFHSLSGLTNIRLGNNSFTTLPSGLFNGLTSLTDLHLGFGRLVSLPANIFDPLTSLKKLGLSNNSISSLPSEIFDKLTSLEELTLNVNRITTFPSGVFDELASLRKLQVWSNPITTLSGSLFDELTSLEVLGVGDFTTKTYPTGIYDSLSSLKELDKSYSDLTSLTADIFDELSTVTKLVLRNNDFTSIPDDMFDGLTSLTELDLSHNEFSSLDVNFFNNVTTLRRLHLNNNAITSLPDGIFDNLTSLTYLNHSSNGLTSLPASIFDTLTSLQYLDLRRNALTSLPDGIFKNLSSLQILDLQNQSDGVVLKVPVNIIVVGEGKFKVRIPTAAPFDIKVHFYVSNGEVDGDYEPTATVSRGTFESAVLTAERGEDDDVNGDVSLYIDYISGWSTNQRGYTLDYDSNLKHILIAAPGEAPEGNLDIIPEETALLTNFPNPFNPETWIPYQLSKQADVTLTFYNLRGVAVRELALGLKPAGYYTNRARAAHWDGRNKHGEKVATGVYFYKFKAGDYEATRKMLIRK